MAHQNELLDLLGELGVDVAGTPIAKEEKKAATPKFTVDKDTADPEETDSEEDNDGDTGVVDKDIRIEGSEHEWSSRSEQNKIKIMCLQES